MKIISVSRRGTRGRLPAANRRGAALVELALVLPLLLVLVLGIIQYAFMFLVMHCMTDAAREGARCLAVRGQTPTQAQTAALNELAHFDPNIRFRATAETVTGPTSVDCVCRVTVPTSDLSLGIDPLFLVMPPEPTLQAKVTMRKEGD